MYVIPTGELKIRDPDRGDHLPPEGREVPPSPFWDRRLRDGDVVEGRRPAEPEAKG